MNNTKPAEKGIQGTVLKNANGNFTYKPNPGEVSDGTFTDTVLVDGVNNGDTETVNLTIADMICFIDEGAGGLNNGTSSNQSTSISVYNGSRLPAAGSTIFVHTGSTFCNGGINTCP